MSSIGKVAALAIAIAAAMLGGCTSLLGDFQLAQTGTDASTTDGSASDGTTGTDGATSTDAGSDSSKPDSGTIDSGGCPAGQMPCGGKCVPNDVSNCGTCGHVCAVGATCDGTKCVCSGGNGATCNGECVDTTSDNANCGSCGRTCIGGQTCQSSRCLCPGSLMFCNGQCVDTQTDNLNCSACGNPCLGGQTCQTALCKCPGAQSICGNACVDINNDQNNCGWCGNVCTGGTCIRGSCQCGGATPDRCGSGTAGGCTSVQTDPFNCGSCGHSCLGGACTGGQCQPVVLGGLTANGQGLDVLGSSVFFTDGIGGNVYSCPTGGCNGSPSRIQGGMSYSNTVRTDPSMSTVYVADSNANWLYQLDTGGSFKFAISSQSNVSGIAVDNSFVYWGTYGSIGRASKYDGSGVISLVPGLGSIVDLAFDPATQSLFAVEYASSGRVLRASTGGALSPPIATFVANPRSITVSAGHVFWGILGTAPNYSDGGVFFCPTTGSGTQVLAQGPNYSFVSAITSDPQFVYFTTGFNVYKCSVSGCGGNPTVIGPGVGVARAISNDSMAVYWINDSGQVMRVAK